MSKTWGIIGLGWLGSSLAKSLEARGEKTWGTHRGSFDMLRDPLPPTACDVLFLNTPPLVTMKPTAYVERVSATNAPRVHFISSTSVYGGGLSTEWTQPAPESPSARWLVEVENGLREGLRERLTVIRPGGLIGGERHPVRSLAGKQHLANGEHSINLIHRDDLIGVIQTQAEGYTPLINAVAPYHPTRNAYYNAWAEKLGLAPIAFENSTKADRKIDSEILPKIYCDWKCPELNFI